jgi:hypothetical protein
VLPLFRSLLLSLRSFGSSIRLLLHLSVPSVVPSLFYKALSTQYVTNLVRVSFIVVCRIFLSFLTLIRLNLSHDRSTRSPPFSSTKFQNFPSISDLLFE